VVAGVALSACYALRGVDFMLGAFEVVAVPATLVWLAFAVSTRPRSRRLLVAPVVAALVVGLTVAQPFGAVVIPNHLGPVRCR